MSIPVTFKERPSGESDPNVSTQPVEAVLAQDAGGKSETIQRDVDGILTTPAWDKNETNPIYEYSTFSGSTYRLTVGMTSLTPEGTTYVYEKHGYYTTGEKPWDNPQPRLSRATS
jgi:hypothetical protein